MSIEVILSLLVIAAVVGAATMYFAIAVPAKTRAVIAQQQIVEIETELRNERATREALAVEKATAAALAERLPVLEHTISELRTQLDSATTAAAAARAELATVQKTHAARVEELERMGAEVERKFAILASEALGKNSENFLALMSERFDKHKVTADKDLEERQQAIERLLKPISESLSKFEHKVGELEKARESDSPRCSHPVGHEKTDVEDLLSLASLIHRRLDSARMPSRA